MKKWKSALFFSYVALEYRKIPYGLLCSIFTPKPCLLFCQPWRSFYADTLVVGQFFLRFLLAVIQTAFWVLM